MRTATVKTLGELIVHLELMFKEYGDIPLTTVHPDCGHFVYGGEAVNVTAATPREWLKSFNCSPKEVALADAPLLLIDTD